jgi:plastocyanin
MHRLLFTTLLVGSAALIGASGCDDDDDDGNGTGGTSGASGAAGVAGTGGSGGSAGAGTGGSAGTSGTGGSAGSAGAGTGGSAGTAGSAGAAGSAGTGDAGPAAQVVDCPASGTTDIAAAGPPFAFAPMAATVAVNGVVKFSNTSADPIEHTATSGAGGVTPAPDGRWDTGDIEPGEAVCVRFLSAGAYPYYCKYHATMMTGTITVQ